MDPSGRKLHGSLNLDHEGTRPTLPGEGKPLRKRRKEEGLELASCKPLVRRCDLESMCMYKLTHLHAHVHTYISMPLGEPVYVQAHMITRTCTHMHQYATRFALRFI